MENQKYISFSLSVLSFLKHTHVNTFMLYNFPLSPIEYVCIYIYISEYIHIQTAMNVYVYVCEYIRKYITYVFINLIFFVIFIVRYCISNGIRISFDSLSFSLFLSLSLLSMNIILQLYFNYQTFGILLTFNIMVVVIE